ncbi:MAG: outer membrane lipoprotein carrier protein LolA, partial [Stenotrophomonas sp.]|nr:outer membrane lipoprotein carrier protein LolA [Stenotrophomonas sp.]
VQALSSQFTVDAQRDAEGWTLALTPKSPMLAKAFSALQLRGDRYVRQVDIVEASKDRTRLTFTALTEAPATLAADEAASLD